MAKGSGRDKQGRFAAGNSFSPGRPRRPTELAYLRALSDLCPLEKWQEVCKRAIDDAVNGDAKSREWLARYLIGESANLTRLVQLECLGIDPADYVRAAADAEISPGGLESLLDYEREGESVISRALKFAQETTSHDAD